jgi:hypothetical protein
MVKQIIEIKLYEEVTEVHQVELTKEEYDKLMDGEHSAYDFITEETLDYKEYGDNADYSIAKWGDDNG